MADMSPTDVLYATMNPALEAAQNYSRTQLALSNALSSKAIDHASKIADEQLRLRNQQELLKEHNANALELQRLNEIAQKELHRLDNERYRDISKDHLRGMEDQTIAAESRANKAREARDKEAEAKILSGQVKFLMQNRIAKGKLETDQQYVDRGMQELSDLGVNVLDFHEKNIQDLMAKHEEAISTAANATAAAAARGLLTAKEQKVVDSFKGQNFETAVKSALSSKALSAEKASEVLSAFTQARDADAASTRLKPAPAMLTMAVKNRDEFLKTPSGMAAQNILALRVPTPIEPPPPPQTVGATFGPVPQSLFGEMSPPQPLAIGPSDVLRSHYASTAAEDATEMEQLQHRLVLAQTGMRGTWMSRKERDQTAKRLKELQATQIKSLSELAAPGEAVGNTQSQDTFTIPPAPMPMTNFPPDLNAIIGPPAKPQGIRYNLDGTINYDPYPPYPVPVPAPEQQGRRNWDGTVDTLKYNWDGTIAH